MFGKWNSPGESSIIFERYEMTAYNIGDLVRIAGRCRCGALALRESSACWHGPRTFVRRVFASGDYLIENEGGAVRLARPDEVCC